jgi:signal transduction histidine kinase
LTGVTAMREVAMQRPLSLLVVDDTEADRELIAVLLDEAFPGAGVARCALPAEAGQVCRDQAFDCVLLDYNMPVMDGLTLAGELRAAFAYLPIILMTSVGDEMLAAEALRGGVSDYLPKSRINIHSFRRTVERSIQACGQAQLIDEQRGELENFAYALAHDFKQPIRQITTFAQLISAEVSGDATAGVRQHLSFLSSAASRLGKLVDVMSQYTLLNQPPDLGNVDLSQVLASVQTSLAPYLAERGAEVISPVQAPTMRGNETLLTQVLQNLVMNGLQYNRSPVPRVEVTVRRDAEHCTIAIKDNGIGIEPEYLAAIFKPLVRLHTNSEFPGSGLGLTLARKAVLAQDGEIWCESTPGGGSVFYVRMLAAHDDQRQLKTRSRRDAPGRRGSQLPISKDPR